MNRLILTLATWALAASLHAGDIVVRPGESLHDALRQAREWRRTNDPRCQGGITITLEAGRYDMTEPLFLRPEDSGTPESPTVVRGQQGAVVCGHPRQQHTQLWPEEGMAPLLDFNTEDRTMTFAMPDSLFQLPPKSEMVVHQRWAIAILRVKELQIHDGRAVVSFLEPESRLEFEHPWPQPVIDREKAHSPSAGQRNSSFLLRTTEQRDGIEELVIVDGANYVRFEGLTFENTCWNRPLHKGHVTLQGGFPLVDAYKLKEKEGLPWDAGLENQAWVERPVSAVTVRHARHVDFNACSFRHLGATALDYADDISDCNVTDCSFDDIGGTAIMVGSFAESPREVHRPYSDLAQRCRRLNISGNTIHKASAEDWGAVAIACGYVSDCTISNNTIAHVNYSGICVGWGWTPHDTGMKNNRIYNNKVQDYARQLYDAGGIYTLSNQPGSSISRNDISQPYPAPYATNDRAFCIYLDARTDGFTIENNTTEGRLIRRDEIGDNHPGPNIHFTQAP